MTRETLTADLRTFVGVVHRQQLPFLAAAIAYYAFLSVVPLLIVGLTVATAVAGETLAAQLLATVDEILTPEAATLLEETLVAGRGRGSVTAVGLVVLLWGSLRVFRGLDIAFSEIYGATTPKPLFRQLRDAALAFAGIGLAVAATVAVTALFTFVPVPLVGLGGPVGLVVVLAVVFFPVYYVFPAAEVTVREAVPGAVFASAGWTGLGTVFGIYTSNAASLELYGILGGVLLLLVWFYFAGFVLLLGAALNVVLGGRAGDRQLQQGRLRGLSQRSMSEADGPNDEDPAGAGTDSGADTGDAGTGADESAGPTGRRDPDVSARITQEDIDELRRELDEMETRIEDRTVHRDELEDDLRGDLKRYVRSKTRRGKATGWGPYLVLLYGTAMTLGAFVYLDGGWAVLAMLVIWLSTLGLYTLMVVVGAAITGAGLPFRLLDKLRSLRG